MTSDDTDGSAGHGAWRQGLLGLAVAVVVVAIVILAMDVPKQLRNLETADTDSAQYSITQFETEALKFSSALVAATASETAPLSDVRRRFDVFYSRVATIEESQALSALRRNTTIRAQIAEVAGFIDRWVPVIDGPDTALRLALPQIQAELQPVLRIARATALEGVRLFASRRQERRESVSDTLSRIAALSVLLMGLLVLFGLALRRESQMRNQSARDNLQTRQRLETILSSSLDAVIASDRAGRIVEYNGAAEKVFGYPREAAIGSSMSQLIIPERYRSRHDEGMSTYLSGQPARFIGRGIVQLEAIRQSGEVFPVDLSLASAQTPDGEIFVAFIRDISNRARAEAALREARDRAVAGEKSKARLLAVMSHEMRTPLNGLLGTMELIDPEPLPPRTRRYLDVIRQSGEQLLSHVNDVLDISRLDAGKMPIRNQPFDLIDFLRDVVDSQRASAAEHGNRITLVPPSPLLREVQGDPDRLRQVLLNFLSNAIKFTRHGEIVIEADCSEGLHATEIRVTDTGLGIAEDDLDRIFDDFDTVDSSYGRETGGTGLGLGIARRLMMAMGGTLGAESIPGDGSVFWLRLSLAPTGEIDTSHAVSEVEDAEAPMAPPLDLLLVEDNAVNRMVARAMLERDGHRVTEAIDGRAGLHLAQAKRFDAILMDISMPGLDGVSASAALRTGEGASANVPIIATTAHAMPEEVESFRRAGMTDVLVKPLTASRLRRCLSRVALGQYARGSESDDAQPLVSASQWHAMKRDLSPEQRDAALQTFHAEMGQFLGAPAADPDREAAAREAHRLAGSAGVFGALRLAQDLRAMSTAAPSLPPADWTALQNRAAQTWASTRDALARMA